MEAFYNFVCNEHSKIETPCLVAHWPRVLENIRQMQRVADKNGVALRPHFKTHKSLRIVDEQIRQGAKGVTVAKVSEAELLAANGVKDIFIANEIVHPLAMQRLKRLVSKINIAAGIDDLRQLEIYEKAFRDEPGTFQVMLEINSGLNRCGLNDDSKIVRLARAVAESKVVNLRGIFTHAGQAYGAQTVQEVHAIARHESEYMGQIKALLAKNNIECGVVSIGSTPTATLGAEGAEVDEIRPGNYVFYDTMQTVLGSCSEQQNALFVLATVISRPDSTRVVIDAGSKALNLDKGAHGTSSVIGHGRVIGYEAVIERLSEEHGVMTVPKDSTLKIGDPLLIVPNHACTVMNLFDQYYAWDQDHFETVKIDARGKSQ